MSVACKYHNFAVCFNVCEMKNKFLESGDFQTLDSNHKDKKCSAFTRTMSGLTYLTISFVISGIHDGSLGST